MDRMHAAAAAGGAHDGSQASQAKHQGQAVMAAFEQDRFVMNEVAPPRDVQAQVAKMADRMLGLVDAALPVLTPQQRVIAAQKLVERADSIELQ